MLVPIYKTTQPNNLDDHNIKIHHCQKPTFNCNFKLLLQGDNLICQIWDSHNHVAEKFSGMLFYIDW